MQQNIEEYLEEVTKTNDIKNSLINLRTDIEDKLFMEHVLSCLYMVEEFHPLLSSLSEKHPDFDFTILQFYDGDFINLTCSVDVLEQDEFVEKINVFLNDFVHVQFSDLQIKKFFPNKDIHIQFTNNYSKDNFSNFIIKNLVNEECMAFLIANKLNNEMPHNFSETNKNKNLKI